MSREQEILMDNLATRHGRVHVSKPYADKSVGMTVPNGMELVVAESGKIIKGRMNLSVDWSQ